MYKVNSLYSRISGLFFFFLFLKFYTKRRYYSYNHEKNRKSFTRLLFDIKIS